MHQSETMLRNCQQIIVSQVLLKLFVNNLSIILLTTGRIDIGLQLLGSDLISSLYRGNPLEIFHWPGKYPYQMDRLIISVREGTISGQASFKSLAEIPSRPVALSLEIRNYMNFFCFFFLLAQSQSVQTLFDFAREYHMSLLAHAFI